MKKALDKNSTPIPNKNAHNKLRIQANIFNLKKGICEKRGINFILNPERLNTFKFRSRMECLLSPFLFNVVQDVLANAIRQVYGIRGSKFGTEEIKLCLFMGNILGYCEHIWKYLKNQLKLV